jgi:hypothetical protein
VYFEVFQLGDERATDANCAVIAEHVRVGLGIQCPPSITAGVSIADHDENAVEDCVGFGPFTSVCTGFPSWAHRAGKPTSLRAYHPPQVLSIFTTLSDDLEA